MYKVILVVPEHRGCVGRQEVYGRGMMPQTAKVLLLYAHPESHDSVANRVLLGPALQLSGITVHGPYVYYPGFFIDIAHEQGLPRQHGATVSQHPLCTWNCPTLLKGWLNRMSSRSFTNGARGNELTGGYWHSMIITGEPRNTCCRNTNRYPVNGILRPFGLITGVRRIYWISPIIVYWTRRQQPEELYSHARAYRDWLANLPTARGIRGGI